MRVSRALLAAAVPVSIALIAFLNARAVSALVEGTMSTPLPVPSVRETATSAALAEAWSRPSVNAVLDRNPFDHLTGPLREPSHASDVPPRNMDPATAPACEGVRPLVLVGDEDQAVAFVSLEYGGKRLMRRRGGEVGDAHVAYVGRDRVWLEGRTGLCQARLFGTSEAAAPPEASQPKKPVQTPLEVELGKQIAKTGPNEYAIDRSAVDRILEAQAELMRQRLVQDKEGDRVAGVKIFGIKPGSVLSMLGIENGDRLETLNGFDMSNPEKMLEAYARLRSGADRLQIHLTRAGKPVNVDYTIR